MVRVPFRAALAAPNDSNVSQGNSNNTLRERGEQRVRAMVGERVGQIATRWENPQP